MVITVGSNGKEWSVVAAAARGLSAFVVSLRGTLALERTNSLDKVDFGLVPTEPAVCKTLLSGPSEGAVGSIVGANFSAQHRAADAADRSVSSISHLPDQMVVLIKCNSFQRGVVVFAEKTRAAFRARDPSRRPGCARATLKLAITVWLRGVSAPVTSSGGAAA